MSQAEKRGVYVYQPFGVQNEPQWSLGRIYGVGGLPIGTRCDGFTKDEAEALVTALLPFQGELRCEHGVAMDVHCCGCHSGYIFDSRKCVCF